MRRFHFNLQRILALRKHEEYEVEMRLAGITSECLALENQIAEARNRMAGTYGAGSIRAGRVDLAQGYAMGAYHAYLDRRIRTLTRELEEKERQRAEIAEEYREAYKKRRVLDNLRDRREGEYYTEARRHEAGVLDEIGATNYHVRREEEGE